MHDSGPVSSRRRSEARLELPTSPFAQGALGVLADYLSELNCRAVLASFEGATRTRMSRLESMHLPALIVHVKRMLDLFHVPRERTIECARRLGELGPASSERARLIVVPVEEEDDIVRARVASRELAMTLGFSEVACTKVATAVSELSRNIFRYAGKGTMLLATLDGEPPGIEVVARDHGPGIADVAAVLAPGYRSRTGMGVGLKGARRLMDELHIESQVGKGTTVTVRKRREG